MKLPRDLSGEELSRALRKRGYHVSRQTGSHVRLSTTERGEHHITIPNHASLRVGTLSAILSEVAEHFDMTREALVEYLFK